MAQNQVIKVSRWGGCLAWRGFTLLLIQQPAVVERLRGRPVGSTASRIDTSTHREPLAFERNTGYTGRGRGRGRGRGGSSQTSSRGGSTQISSRGALQATVQSNQST